MRGAGNAGIMHVKTLTPYDLIEVLTNRRPKPIIQVVGPTWSLN